jgi:hypothetical protein
MLPLNLKKSISASYVLATCAVVELFVVNCVKCEFERWRELFLASVKVHKVDKMFDDQLLP